VGRVELVEGVEEGLVVLVGDVQDKACGEYDDDAVSALSHDKGFV
jgi:hypothetical protein